MANKYLKKDGASLLVEHILSFDEKGFIEKYEADLYPQLEARAKRKMLRNMYRDAKNLGIEPGDKK